MPFRVLRSTASEGEEREADPFFQSIFVFLVFFKKEEFLTIVGFLPLP